MSSTEAFVGRDVSKAWLDLHRLPDATCRQLANAPEGIQALCRMLAERGRPA